MGFSDNSSLISGSGGGSGAGGEPIGGDAAGVEGLGASLLGALALDPLAYSLENNDFGGFNNTSIVVPENIGGRGSSDDWSSW